jgi:hypothetical protein
MEWAEKSVRKEAYAHLAPVLLRVVIERVAGTPTDTKQAGSSEQRAMFFN